MFHGPGSCPQAPSSNPILLNNKLLIRIWTKPLWTMLSLYIQRFLFVCHPSLGHACRDYRQTWLPWQVWKQIYFTLRLQTNRQQSHGLMPQIWLSTPCCKKYTEIQGGSSSSRRCSCLVNEEEKRDTWTNLTFKAHGSKIICVSLLSAREARNGLLHSLHSELTPFQLYLEHLVL